jgi:hypothetical protein
MAIVKQLGMYAKFDILPEIAPLQEQSRVYLFIFIYLFPSKLKST